MLNLRRLSTPSGRDREPGEETSREHRGVAAKPSDGSGDSERFQAYIEAAAGRARGDSIEHGADVALGQAADQHVEGVVDRGAALDAQAQSVRDRLRKQLRFRDGGEP